MNFADFLDCYNQANSLHWKNNTLNSNYLELTRSKSDYYDRNMLTELKEKKLPTMMCNKGNSAFKKV